MPLARGGTKLHSQYRHAANEIRSFVTKKIGPSLLSFGRSVFGPSLTQAVQKAASSSNLHDQDIGMESELDDPTGNRTLQKTQIISTLKLCGGEPVDWALQESNLSALATVNSYVSAISAHNMYWDSEDVAAFILRNTLTR